VRTPTSPQTRRSQRASAARLAAGLRWVPSGYPSCVASMATTATCGRCGAEIAADAAFCPHCGDATARGRAGGPVLVGFTILGMLGPRPARSEPRPSSSRGELEPERHAVELDEDGCDRRHHLTVHRHARASLASPGDEQADGVVAIAVVESDDGRRVGAGRAPAPATPPRPPRRGARGSWRGRRRRSTSRADRRRALRSRPRRVRRCPTRATSGCPPADVPARPTDPGGARHRLRRPRVRRRRRPGRPGRPTWQPSCRGRCGERRRHRRARRDLPLRPAPVSVMIRRSRTSAVISAVSRARPTNELRSVGRR
jgi:hypothetical protein